MQILRFLAFFCFFLHRATTHRTPVAHINNLMMISRRFAYFVKLTFSFFSNFLGPVAQWIRHLTTNQGIPGSSPGRIGSFDQPTTKLASHQNSIKRLYATSKYRNKIPGAYWRCISRITILRFLALFWQLFLPGRSRDLASNPSRVDRSSDDDFGGI